MANKQLCVALIVFFCFVFITPYRASACDLSVIRAEYSARGLSGSGMEQEAIDNCLTTQRRLDQQVRDQQVVDAAAQVNTNQFNQQLLMDQLRREQNSNKASSLSSTFGYTNYFSCYSQLCIGKDLSDPWTETLCLSSVEICLLSRKCQEHATYQGGSCSCDSGYFGRDNKCMTGTEICILDGGAHRVYLGSVNEITHMLSCGCESGYEWINSRCVIKATKTNDQICSDAYGINSNWDGTTTKEGKINCGCKSGYIWNTQQASCIIKQVVVVKTNDQICQDKYGSNSNWSGTKNSAGGLVCGCSTGYQWNQPQTDCLPVELAKKSSDLGGQSYSKSVSSNFVKTKDYSAVYWISADNKRYLFSNRDVFGSWFVDDFSGLRIIEQSEFDNLQSGENLTVKPGNYLKFDNSAIIYYVQDNNNICKTTNQPSQTYLVQSSFEADYNVVGNCQ